MIWQPLLTCVLLLVICAGAAGVARCQSLLAKVIGLMVALVGAVGLLILFRQPLEAIVFDLFKGNGKSALFWVFSLTTCGGAIGVVLSQNVVRMAFWLIISLGASAGLFFLLNADFVGTAQLLVYVGGTLVLLVFGVMLTASGPSSQLQARPGEAFMAGIVALSLLVLLSMSVCSVDWKSVVAATNKGQAISAAQAVGTGYNRPEEGNTARPLGMALLGIRVDHGIGGVDNANRTGYLLPFEIASVHLLVVLIGAAYLARAKRRVQANQTD